MSGIKDFQARAPGADYYHELVAELAEANRELNAFAVINESISKGFPVSVKDNICVSGFEATASSRMLKGYVPPFDATCVARLKSKGMGFIGKTVMDEFGFGTFGLNCDIRARNPFDKEYVAGGSSSGSAVATSIISNHASVSESTGGSISTPASMCGVVGFTPTYGAVSRYGLIDYANSLDKIGVMARSASIVREVFDMMRGPDDMDSTSSKSQITDNRHKKLVVVNQLLSNVDPAVRKSFESLLHKLEGEGHSVDYVDMHFINDAVRAYYIISMAEASTTLARYTGYKYGYQHEKFEEKYNQFFSEARENFGLEAKRRIVLGTFIRGANVRSRYYYKALKIRRAIIDSMAKAMKDAFIISPTVPIRTPKASDAERLSPVEVYALDSMTIPPNLAGMPHISFPYDYIDGMPIGAQLTTTHFNDHAVISFVEEWEKAFSYRFKYNIGSL
ncbi:MAG: Asp-tRNA(Asn)/Glu-tRNA(Gln) amidotransferase subunit GatA [Candidatus Micrarchaeota archaeon]|nr:Asp-tRNA(Asn)/Glu-tRNA(Gln) amidotransferase subunit GatA [Candidatus Micrarchaeota archaeon]